MPSLCVLLSRIDEVKRGAEGVIESALRSVIRAWIYYGLAGLQTRWVSTAKFSSVLGGLEPG